MRPANFDQCITTLLPLEPLKGLQTLAINCNLPVSRVTHRLAADCVSMATRSLADYDQQIATLVSRVRATQRLATSDQCLALHSKFVALPSLEPPRGYQSIAALPSLEPLRGDQNIATLLLSSPSPSYSEVGNYRSVLRNITVSRATQRQSWHCNITVSRVPWRLAADHASWLIPRIAD